MQRTESKQGPQQPRASSSALDTFFSSYSQHIESAQNIDLDMDKLIEQYNRQIAPIDPKGAFPVPKAQIAIEKDSIKALSLKLKGLGDDKLVQIVTNVEKLNSKLVQDITTELNYSVSLGLIKRIKQSDVE